MIKETIFTAIIGASAASGLYMADARYVMQSTYEQSVNQRRAWELQDKIDQVNGQADYENRPLSSYEKQQIKQWEQQLRRLGI